MYESGCRTVIIRNLTVFVQYRDVVDLASRCGQILSMNIDRKSEGAIAYVNFVETRAAEIFNMALRNNHLRFENQDGLEFIRGKPTGVPPNVVLDLERGGASRDLIVSGLSTLMTDVQVRAMFQSYTAKLEFESVKIVSPGVASVKCLSIQDALKIRSTFDGQNMMIVHYNMEELDAIEFTLERVSKKAVDIKGLRHFERQLPKSINANGTVATKEQLLDVPVVGFISQSMESGIEGKPLMLMRQEDRHAFPPSLDIFMGAPPRLQLPEGEPSRGIYIGYLDPATTYRDICRLGNSFGTFFFFLSHNSLTRSQQMNPGTLEFVKLVPQKSCAFINFIHMEDAKKMYKVASEKAISLHNRRISVGWAKSNPMFPNIENFARNGATRNLYLSNLSQDVSENFIVALFKSSLLQNKGGIQFAKEHCVESLVINRQRGFAFLNTTSITGAIAMKTRYGDDCRIGDQQIRISFAKERVSMCPKLDRVVRHLYIYIYTILKTFFFFFIHHPINPCTYNRYQKFNQV